MRSTGNYIADGIDLITSQKEVEPPQKTCTHCDNPPVKTVVTDVRGKKYEEPVCQFCLMEIEKNSDEVIVTIPLTL